MPRDWATRTAGTESPTRWHATPSTSWMVRPASTRAAAMARNASARVLTPEFFEYSVHPIPAMAARSRSGWVTAIREWRSPGARAAGAQARLRGGDRHHGVVEGGEQRQPGVAHRGTYVGRVRRRGALEVAQHDGDP